MTDANLIPIMTDPLGRYWLQPPREAIVLVSPLVRHRAGQAQPVLEQRAGDHPVLKERPILMSAPMVRALLDGEKTQTRRIWKMPRGLEWYTSGALRGMETGDIHDPLGPWWGHVSEVRCPHGRPDDRLWVREEHYCFGHWEPVPGMKTKAGRMKWRFVQDTGEVLHAPPQSFRLGRHHKDPATPAWHKRLARFMPRRYARITLEIADVRVERLQDISEADAKAEGVSMPDDTPTPPEWWSYRQEYAHLWDRINGTGSWDENPWVWVIDFHQLAGREHNDLPRRFA